MEGMTKGKIFNLTKIPNTRQEKNKAITEFILLCLHNIYGYDNPKDVLTASAKYLKYRDARKILFYMVKVNTGMTFKEIHDNLSSSYPEKIWEAYNEVKELKKSSIESDITINIKNIQYNLDVYLKTWVKSK